MIKFPTTTLLRGLVVLSFFSVGWAADVLAVCTPTNPTTMTAGSREEAHRCLAMVAGVDLAKCELQVCKEVMTWQAGTPGSLVGEARRKATLIRDDLADRVVPTFPNAHAIQARLEDWLAMTKDLAASSPASAWSPIFTTAGTSSWKFDNVALVLIGENQGPMKLGNLLDDACANGPADCTAALRGTAEMAIHSRLMGTLVGRLLATERTDALSHLQMIDKQWASYFDKARFQYPWELAINSSRYHPDPKDTFPSPPENQVILMHPSLGFRYERSASRSLDQALVLEVAGYYRWKWDGAEQKDLYGASLIATWINDPAAKKAGYGVMVHLPKSWSIGVVRGDTLSGHKTSVIIGADLAKLFQDNAVLKKVLLGE